ncbi:MAG: BMC domain-containing protein, partial [Cyanobacteria bacterium]|nr:BMC domain-containing protein [Cyanobacteriota bacterium]
DAMTKAADIQVVAHQTIGSGLCTVIIRGSLPNVAIAIDSGMHEAERIGELHAVMIIPRPLDDLERSLPMAEMTTEQPVRLPLKLEEKEKELVPLAEAASAEVTQALSMSELQPHPEAVIPSQAAEPVTAPLTEADFD